MFRTLMSYRNPVYPHDFADPFVLKYRGTYWAYCTGFQADGRVFGILHSDDLVHWDYSGGAMDPLPGGHTCYWAPEVSYENDGSFLMYYSVGNEEHMVIRVARAESPAGPFHDVGVELTKEPFAIDAHIFKDDDGSRYLFYATDFLTHTHIGTGTVVAKMKGPFSLDSDAIPVTRAKYDWQVYDPKRESKGGVRWHTVEGPFVLKRKGIYYEMFSGGNWQNISYGVSFATSDRVMRSDEWQQHADGQAILPILRTIPGKVLGPGHNSVVRGTNNRDEYCVYHEWVNGERVLAIDRIDWCGSEMILLGPTIEDQVGPFRAERLLDSCQLSAVKKIQLRSPSGIADFWIKLNADESIQLVLEAEDGSQVFAERLESSSTLLPNVWHNVRLEFDWRQVELRVGNHTLRVATTLSFAAASLHLRSTGSPEIEALDITYGWEELFDEQEISALCTRGWQSEAWEQLRMRDSELLCNANSRSATLLKTLRSIADMEIVVNLRILNGPSKVELILGAPDNALTFEVVADHTAELARITRGSVTVAEAHVMGDAGRYHQLRIRTSKGITHLQFDDTQLSTIELSAGQQLALRAMGGAAFDMVRVTEIQSA